MSREQAFELIVMRGIFDEDFCDNSFNFGVQAGPLVSCIRVINKQHLYQNTIKSWASIKFCSITYGCRTHVWKPPESHTLSQPGKTCGPPRN